MSVPSTTSVISLFSVSAILNFWYAHDYCQTLRIVSESRKSESQVILSETTKSNKSGFLVSSVGTTNRQIGNLTVRFLIFFTDAITRAP